MGVSWIWKLGLSVWLPEEVLLPFSSENTATNTTPPTEHNTAMTWKTVSDKSISCITQICIIFSFHASIIIMAFSLLWSAKIATDHVIFGGHYCRSCDPSMKVMWHLEVIKCWQTLQPPLPHVLKVVCISETRPSKRWLSLSESAQTGWMQTSQ